MIVRDGFGGMLPVYLSLPIGIFNRLSELLYFHWTCVTGGY
jgi:hypothetical protein